ncbi:beta-1,6-N-acetylglucosaminyltransferase [Parapedobacter sp. 2B3]|uniref:beta-1,6-N-acetylglucosaminyltransferase n=1 Tax=Parapedobacter sp. 2B3 TaxID=3342381 RepID=UPI0035B61D44
MLTTISSVLGLQSEVDTMIAHLILVHCHPAQLAKLVKALIHPRSAVYIHVDKKAAIEPFVDAVGALPNCHFVKNRSSVNWGGYSMVKATLHSFSEIAESGVDYTFINLLSGADYPLRPAGHFHAYLAHHRGKSFFEFETEGSSWWHKAKSRFTHYHFTDVRLRGKYLFQRLVNTVTKERKPPGGLTIVGRSQWFTIAMQHVNYILAYIRNNPAIERFFKYTWGPDELFFQTILLNSIYRDDIINDNLRYIDWSDGLPSPKTLSETDFCNLQASGKWFARKLHVDISATLMDRIDNELLTDHNVAEQ